MLQIESFILWQNYFCVKGCSQKNWCEESKVEGFWQATKDRVQNESHAAATHIQLTNFWTLGQLQRPLLLDGFHDHFTTSHSWGLNVHLTHEINFILTTVHRYIHGYTIRFPEILWCFGLTAREDLPQVTQPRLIRPQLESQQRSPALQTFTARLADCVGCGRVCSPALQS